LDVRSTWLAVNRGPLTAKGLINRDRPHNLPDAVRSPNATDLTRYTT